MERFPSFHGIDSALFEEDYNYKLLENCTAREEWYNIKEYFLIYKTRITSEYKLIKDKNIPVSILSLDPHIYSIFFGFKEEMGFSEDIIMNAIEIYQRLLLVEFLEKINNIRELKEFLIFKESDEQYCIKKFQNTRKIDLICSLLLAKKYCSQGGPIISVTKIQKVFGEDYSLDEIVSNEFRILKKLDYQINLTTISNYCHILFEIIDGTKFSIKREQFYRLTNEVVKVVYMHLRELISKLGNIYHKELISIAVLYTVLNQLSISKQDVLFEEVSKSLENLTTVSRQDLLYASMLILRQIYL